MLHGVHMQVHRLIVKHGGSRIIPPMLIHQINQILTIEKERKKYNCYLIR